MSHRRNNTSFYANTQGLFDAIPLTWHPLHRENNVTDVREQLLCCHLLLSQMIFWHDVKNDACKSILLSTRWRLGYSLLLPSWEFVCVHLSDGRRTLNNTFGHKNHLTFSLFAQRTLSRFWFSLHDAGGDDTKQLRSGHIIIYTREKGRGLHSTIF